MIYTDLRKYRKIIQRKIYDVIIIGGTNENRLFIQPIT